MIEEDETKFNSSLKTSDHIRTTCNEIGMWIAQDKLKVAHRQLYMMNNEISGWYYKKNKLELFEPLKGIETSVDKLSANLNNDSTRYTYKVLLKNWLRRVTQECYKIGWFGEDKQNIYDSGRT